MGPMVFIEANNGAKCPDGFTKSDSKGFAYLLIEHLQSESLRHPLAAVANHFNLDVTPLKKIAGQDWSREEFLSMIRDREKAEREYMLSQQRNKDAWQTPSVWIGCLRPLTEALDSNPQVFSTLEGLSGWQHDGYVMEGFLQQDLKDLLHIMEWHQANGAGRVRLVLA